MRLGLGVTMVHCLSNACAFGEASDGDVDRVQHFHLPARYDSWTRVKAAAMARSLRLLAISCRVEGVVDRVVH